MKQHITIEQFMELTDLGKGRLWDFATPKQYLVTGKDHQTIYQLLSIGQMIEFLDEHGETDYLLEEYAIYGHYGESELCDQLWHSVKEILNKENK